MKEKSQTINNIFGIISGILLILSLLSPGNFQNSNIDFLLIILGSLRFELITLILITLVFSRRSRAFIKEKLKSVEHNLFIKTTHGKNSNFFRNILVGLSILALMGVSFEIGQIIIIRAHYLRNFKTVLENKFYTRAIEFENNNHFYNAILNYNNLLKYFPNSDNKDNVEARILTIKNYISMADLLEEKPLTRSDSIFTRIEFSQLLNSYSLFPNNNKVKVALGKYYRRINLSVDSIPVFYRLTLNADTIRLRDFVLSNGWVYFEKDLYYDLMNSSKNLNTICKEIVSNFSSEEFTNTINSSWYISSNQAIFNQFKKVRL